MARYLGHRAPHLWRQRRCVCGGPSRTAAVGRVPVDHGPLDRGPMARPGPPRRTHPSAQWCGRWILLALWVVLAPYPRAHAADRPVDTLATGIAVTGGGANGTAAMLHPPSPLPLIARARAERQSGRLREAYATLRLAEIQLPGNPALDLELAQVYRAAHLTAKAQESLLAAVRMVPDHVRIHRLLVDILRRGGADYAASAELAWVVARQSRGGQTPEPQLVAELAGLYGRLGMLDEAVTTWSRYLVLQPDPGARRLALDELSAVLARANRGPRPPAPGP